MLTALSDLFMSFQFYSAFVLFLNKYMYIGCDMRLSGAMECATTPFISTPLILGWFQGGPGLSMALIENSAPVAPSEVHDKAY